MIRKCRFKSEIVPFFTVLPLIKSLVDYFFVFFLFQRFLWTSWSDDVSMTGWSTSSLFCSVSISPSQICLFPFQLSMQTVFFRKLRNQKSNKRKRKFSSLSLDGESSPLLAWSHDERVRMIHWKKNLRGTKQTRNLFYPFFLPHLSIHINRRWLTLLPVDKQCAIMTHHFFEIAQVDLFAKSDFCLWLNSHEENGLNF